MNQTVLIAKNTIMDTPSQDRRQLRAKLIAARENMSMTVRSRCETALAGHLRRLLDKVEPRIIGFCWPFRGEPDLVGMLQEWASASPQRQLGLPRVPEIPGPLRFHLWTDSVAMEKDRYGIPAPVGTPVVVPDVLLIPLNGFDARGYRIGYGGGYFDRTLAQADRPVTVGVGFEVARLEDVRPAAHDLPLEWIVTEAGIVVSPPCQG